jgi:penicillin amidase
MGFVAAGSAHGSDFLDENHAVHVAGLHAPAVVLRDEDGIPHIYAWDEHDALFMQGYLQAQDRLFQIDVLRHTASGTLAELVGQSALPSDIELRTIGLRRAAERSLAAYSPAARAGLEAYAEGVNAWVGRNALPAEYAALELTRFDPWTALDSALIGKALAFQLSFDLDIDATLQYLEYQEKLAPLDPQLPDAAFFLDVFRSAPFDPAASVPDANSQAPRPPHHVKSSGNGVKLDRAAARELRQYRERVEQVPFMRRTLSRAERQIGSNEWAVAGRFTRNGRPLVANDPHLSLDLPPNFYDLQITTFKDGLDAIGSSVAGTPWVVLGQNRYVTWGETTTGFDVTDTYQEQVVPDPRSPSGLSTLYQGQLEPVIPIPVTFKVNLRDGGAPDTVVPVPAGGGIPPVVLIVPRRNNGPIVQLDQATGVAISVQYAGFSGTRELETFRLLNRARNLADFKAALQFFDVGSQNFIYGDIRGNIGYFTSGEVPLREDLQAGGIDGAPPWFIRNGQGGNEWIRKTSLAATDGTGYEYLPFAELPQVVNPPSGFVVNANNDPAGVTLDNNPVNQVRPGGSGLYYLGYTFDFGTRAGRITQALREKLVRGRVDADDMAELQGDVTLLDASVLAPYIVRAFANARSAQAPAALQALADDARIAEAVGRLAEWNYTAPTGVDSGYDAADKNGDLLPPRPQEIRASIAATIYSVWRGQAIANGVDRTLQGLGVPTPGSGEAMKALRHLIERDGVGLSTIDFFGWVPLAEPAQRRDFVLLKSLSDALDLLAGPAFAPAFAGSTAQNDYRWGRLHRITLDGILGGPFSIPGATPGFPPSFDDLAGLAVDGGFGVVDASSHSARSANANAFTFGSGPNRRYVGSPHLWPGSIEAQSILPGGNSGVLGNEFYANLLGRWLTNDSYPFRQQIDEVVRALDSHQVYRPARAP